MSHYGKRKRQTEGPLTPIERALRERKFKQRRITANSQVEVIVYHRTLIAPQKKDFNKLRKDLCQLTSGEPGMGNLPSTNDERARGLRITTNNAEEGNKLCDLINGMEDWAASFKDPVDSECLLQLHIGEECPEDQLETREGIEELVTFCIGHMVDPEEVTIYRPPVLIERSKRHIIFLRTSKEQVKALIKRKETKGGEAHCPLSRAWINFADQQTLLSRELHNISVNLSDPITEKQDRSKKPAKPGSSILNTPKSHQPRKNGD